MGDGFRRRAETGDRLGDRGRTDRRNRARNRRHGLRRDGKWIVAIRQLERRPRRENVEGQGLAETGVAVYLYAYRLQRRRKVLRGRDVRGPALPARRRLSGGRRPPDA